MFSSSASMLSYVTSSSALFRLYPCTSRASLPFSRILQVRCKRDHSNVISVGSSYTITDYSTELPGHSRFVLRCLAKTCSSVVDYGSSLSKISGVISTGSISIKYGLMDKIQSILFDVSTWFIKRTFQPSLVRKRRKHGFLRRQESVGGRRVLKRRMAKGRMRLGGS